METTRNNRRAAARILEPGGIALCRTGNRTQRYHIQDASKTGIALKGGPWLRLDTPVDLSMSWPMIGSASASGVVCRSDVDKSKLAVRYTSVDGVVDLVGNLIAIDEMRRREPMPLFCGQDGALDLAMNELEEAGVAFAHARFPIEAIAFLQDPWNPITTVVFAPTVRWLEFSVYMKSEGPELRRVLLASADSPADGRLAVDHTLVDVSVREPWSSKDLYDALGLELSERRCLSCDNRLATSSTPFCSSCRNRSSNLSEQDDLGDGD